MENVVYILGAGFSAPAGLPTISNFLLKAKDLVFGGDDAMAVDIQTAFKNVLRHIDELARIKNYARSDLFNIEEAFSIAEMQAQLDEQGRGNLRDNYVSVIKYVIEQYTPAIVGSDWTNSILRGYKDFAAALLGLGRIDGENRSARCESDFSYQVITLNYDTLLENAIDVFRMEHPPSAVTEFVTPHKFRHQSGETLLAKIHGSVDGIQIVPPTWSKAIGDELRQTWQQAFRALSEARHIRILGYSLPVTDSYIRYFLKAALSQCRHLKSIDVCTLDSDGTVSERFRDFFDFKYFRFFNRNVEEFLWHVRPIQLAPGLGERTPIESAHEMFYR